ncbi:FkbM family methyltransferase [Cohnella sp. AR92]|uniref:FkbM family methyltransferase n=1 Tax=Cohnella sp. AR92 TaxID=648716 RepID=UPI001EE05B83|nr:FkbM family methyltransferase [Cohnella sp. AR92]
MLNLSRPHVYVGDHTVLTNLNHGPAMLLDLRDPVCLSILLEGEWEPWLSGFFLTVVKPGMTVLDIGAHSGYFSLLAAMRTGPTGTVHAFEPNPFHHRNLLKSATLNGFGNVKLHRVMVSNKRGEKLLRTMGEGGTSIFYPDLAELNGVTENRVPLALLTDYLGPTLKADVIKIDIDGGEPYIMDSLFEIIDRNGNMVIFMEYLPILWGQTDPVPYMRKFVERGFKLFNVPRTGPVEPTTPDELAKFNGVVHLDLLLVR